MVFFIGGIQPRTVVLESRDLSCSVCGRVGIQLKRVDHYISIFFIPIIRIKKGNSFYICKNCNSFVDRDGKTIGFEKDSKKRKCQYCGETVLSDFSYCPFCGKKT